MKKRITKEDIMNVLTSIQGDITDLNSRVTALEKGSTVPTANPKATVKGKATVKSKATVDMADFEPVKGADGYYNWSSYKANRTKYCYAVATNGEVTDGKPYGTNWYGKVDFAEDGAYYTAKASYDAKFGYTKKSDRK